MRNGKSWLVVVLFAVLVCGGCAAYGPKRAEGSGFLGGPEEYEQMRQVNGLLKKAAYAWIRPGVNWEQFKYIYVAPVSVMFNDPQDAAKVDPADVEKLKVAFRNAMMKELGKSYTIVNGPARDVLEIRACLTNIQPNKAARNIALKVAGSPVSVYSGAVSIELDMRDGGNGQRIATFMDTKAGESSGLFSMATNSYTKWGNVESAFVNWAKGLREQLEKIQKSDGVPDKYFREPKQ